MCKRSPVASVSFEKARQTEGELNILPRKPLIFFRLKLFNILLVSLELARCCRPVSRHPNLRFEMQLKNLNEAFTWQINPVFQSRIESQDLDLAL